MKVVKVIIVGLSLFSISHSGILSSSTEVEDSSSSSILSSSSEMVSSSFDNALSSDEYSSSSEDELTTVNVRYENDTYKIKVFMSGQPISLSENNFVEVFSLDGKSLYKGWNLNAYLTQMSFHNELLVLKEHK